MIALGQLHPRGKALAVYLLVLSVLFVVPLSHLFRFALRDELFSYIILIPAIVVYLGLLRRGSLAEESQAAWPQAIVLGLAGTVAVGGWFALFSANAPGAGAVLPPSSHPSKTPDGLALVVLAYVFFAWAGAYAVWGRQWMRQLLFPAMMLFFLVPFPGVVMNGIEVFFQRASAEATQILFDLSGTTYMRTGQVFELPGIPIVVAQECSGVRSSLVLFLTSLIAGHLFLRTVSAKVFLALFIIPLGIVRNAFRIFVISQLCIHIDPKMINSYIHRHGGPIFFVFSMIPFFAVLLGLRWWEQRSRASLDASSSSSP